MLKAKALSIYCVLMWMDTLSREAFFFYFSSCHPFERDQLLKGRICSSSSKVFLFKEDGILKGFFAKNRKSKVAPLCKKGRRTSILNRKHGFQAYPRFGHLHLLISVTDSLILISTCTIWGEFIKGQVTAQTVQTLIRQLQGAVRSETINFAFIILSPYQSSYWNVWEQLSKPAYLEVSILARRAWASSSCSNNLSVNTLSR